MKYAIMLAFVSVGCGFAPLWSCVRCVVRWLDVFCVVMRGVALVCVAVFGLRFLRLRCVL